MDYTLSLDVPAKYLGSSIGGELAKLSASDLETMTVALPIGLSGTFNSPNVSVNTKQAAQQLTQQIIATQKDKAIDKTKDKIKDLLGGDKEEQTNTTTKDTTTTTPKDKEDKIKEAAGNVIKDLFGKGKDKK